MPRTQAHRPGREPVGSASAVGLLCIPLRDGRLPPSDWYPAGVPGVEASFLELPGGERARVLTTGPATGAPVVLVHGWACSAYSWRHQLPVLAAAGFRVVALDLRGHGLSAHPLGGDRYTTARMAEFLGWVLDELAIRRVALVGHSLGAAVATRLALEQPERVGRLVTIGGVGFGRTSLVPILRHLPDWLARPFLPLARSRALFGLVLRLVGGPAQYTPRDVEEYWAATQFPGFIPALWSLVRRFDWRELTREERARLARRAPHLLVFGGRDRLVRTRSSLRAPDAVASDAVASDAVASEVVLEGVGHAIQEEAPDAVNELLLSFLAPWAVEAARRG